MAQSLTATAGTWTPSDGTYAYQWLADGTPIAGATTAAYMVAAGDLGKVLTVRVTASKPGFVTDSATSGATSAVPQPQVTNTALPTISDTTPEVGQVLTAGDGTWTPSGVTLAYQWRSDGTDIGGAVSKTFQVPAGQLGKKLSVRVMATRAEHLPGSATGETTAVAAATTPFISNTAKPAVDDATPVVGQTVSASDGTWSETSGLDVRVPVARGQRRHHRRHRQDVRRGRRAGGRPALGGGDGGQVRLHPRRRHLRPDLAGRAAADDRQHRPPGRQRQRRPSARR